MCPPPSSKDKDVEGAPVSKYPCVTGEDGVPRINGVAVDPLQGARAARHQTAIESGRIETESRDAPERKWAAPRDTLCARCGRETRPARPRRTRPPGRASRARRGAVGGWFTTLGRAPPRTQTSTLL